MSKPKTPLAHDTAPNDDALTHEHAAFANYVAKADEAYMNERQLAHFKAKLLHWKTALVNEAEHTLKHIKASETYYADVVDRASQEEAFGLELRTRDRERKLINKINEALARIENGTYGYCKITDEPIGLARLDARPTTDLSLAAKEMQEKRELKKRNFS